MATYLDVADLKAYLGIGTSDTRDDWLLGQIVDAVEAQQRARLIPAAFPEPETSGLAPISPDVYQAALMRGARLYMRRASPEGIVGLGDLGVARVPSYDRDIDVAESPWLQIVVA